MFEMRQYKVVFLVMLCVASATLLLIMSDDSNKAGFLSSLVGVFKVLIISAR
jgi:hypothetical protein